MSQKRTHKQYTKAFKEETVALVGTRVFGSAGSEITGYW